MDTIIITALTCNETVECRVTKLSKKPAIINRGIHPATSVNPLLVPRLNDSTRLYVFGNMILLPKQKPAAPATMIDDISSTPCIQTVSSDTSK